jgi:transposase
MKFKSQDKQNQLIVKITAQHLVVRIDIAQQTHVACAVNFRGIVVGNPLSFPNDDEGFQILLRWVQSLQYKSDIKDALVIADMEKNGYYSFIRNTPEAFEELLVFLSNRDSVVTRLVSVKNQIHRWVDIVFHELRQVIKNIMCTGSLANFVFSLRPKNCVNYSLMKSC